MFVFSVSLCFVLTMAAHDPLMDGDLHVGTFNVRGAASAESRRQLVADMKKYNVHVCCIQETKIASESTWTIDDHTFLTVDTGDIHRGLGFIVGPRVARSVQRIWRSPHTDRIAMLELKLHLRNHRLQQVVFINVHAPTAAATKTDPDARDTFYGLLSDCVRDLRANCIVWIAGDFNARVGKRRSYETVLGSFTKDLRNDNGQALVEFAHQHDFVLTNTFFQHPQRHVTTWQGVHPKTKAPYFTQIDFILCQRHHLSTITDARSYAGTLKESDHHLVLAKARCTRLYALWHTKFFKAAPRWNAKTLATDKNAQKTFKSSMDATLKDAMTTNMETTVVNLRAMFAKAATKTNLTARPSETKKFVDAEVALLSQQQKALRLMINVRAKQPGTTPAELTALRHQRNKIKHSLNKRLLKVANDLIDEQAKRVEALKDGSQMFEAVKLLRSKTKQKVVVKDDLGHTICDEHTKADMVSEHFASKFNTGQDKLEPFITDPAPLNQPISPNEVESVVKKLKNNRACGHDNVPNEFFKHSPPSLHTFVAQIFNRAFETNQDPALGFGILIPLPKPKKPIGIMSSLRPIILLDTMRKILSLITLERARPAFDAFLPPSQAAFRQGRSTADIVFCKRWLCSIVIRFYTTISGLGLDMTSAFDTVKRGRLMGVIVNITGAGSDIVRLSQLLLAVTSIAVRVGKAEAKPFVSDIGSPQGDGISPIYFTIYLEAALREARAKFPSVTFEVAPIPHETCFADDVDFFGAKDWLSQIFDVLSAVLPQWNISINVAKTEKFTIYLAPSFACPMCAQEAEIDVAECSRCKRWLHFVCMKLSKEMLADPFVCVLCDAAGKYKFVCPRCAGDADVGAAIGCDKCQAWFHVKCVDPSLLPPDLKSSEKWLCANCRLDTRGNEAWRHVKSLGNYYDSEVDARHRITLAQAAFARLWKLWLRRKFVSLPRRLRLYRAFVLPVLTYNIGCLATNQQIERALDVCQRSQLRSLLGIRYPDKITNEALVRKTKMPDVSEVAFHARWRLLGHVLRLPVNTPAHASIRAFFLCSAKPRRGRPLSCLATTFQNDTRNSVQKMLSISDIDRLTAIASDRTAWARLVREVEKDRTHAKPTQ